MEQIAEDSKLKSEQMQVEMERNLKVDLKMKIDWKWSWNWKIKEAAKGRRANINKVNSIYDKRAKQEAIKIKEMAEGVQNSTAPSKSWYLIT